MRNLLRHAREFYNALCSPVAYPWFMLGLFVGGLAGLLGAISSRVL